MVEINRFLKDCSKLSGSQRRLVESKRFRVAQSKNFPMPQLNQFVPIV